MVEENKKLRLHDLLEKVKRGQIEERENARKLSRELGFSEEAVDEALYFGSEACYHKNLQKIRDGDVMGISFARHLVEEYGLDETPLYEAIQECNRVNPNHTWDYEARHATPVQKRIENMVTGGTRYQRPWWSSIRRATSHTTEAELRLYLKMMDTHTGKYDMEKAIGELMVEVAGQGLGLNDEISGLVMSMVGIPKDAVPVVVEREYGSKGEAKYCLIVEGEKPKNKA